MDDAEKKDFLEQIHSLPAWVRNEDDLMKYSMHLMYRLLQTQSAIKFYEKNVNLTDDQIAELNEIYVSYDKCYQNDTSKLIPLKFINFIPAEDGLTNLKKPEIPRE